MTHNDSTLNHRVHHDFYSSKYLGHSPFSQPAYTYGIRPGYRNLHSEWNWRDAPLRVSSDGFQRKLVHGNASFLLLNFSSSSTRNNSLYLCHPLSYFSFFLPSIYIPPTPFFGFLLFQSHFFLSRKHWKNTSKGGNNSFLASWSSFDRFYRCPRSSFITYILLHETMLLRKHVLKERYCTQIIALLNEMKAKLSDTFAENIAKLRNRFIEISFPFFVIRRVIFIWNLAEDRFDKSFVAVGQDFEKAFTQSPCDS